MICQLLRKIFKNPSSLPRPGSKCCSGCCPSRSGCTPSDRGYQEGHSPGWGAPRNKIWLKFMALKYLFPNLKNLIFQYSDNWRLDLNIFYVAAFIIYITHFFFIGNSVAKASAWDFGQIFRLFSKIIDFSWIFWYEMNALIKRSHLNMFLQVG